LKRKAREKGTGRFASKKDTEEEKAECAQKRKVGRPRKKAPERDKFTFELSITISMGGGDVAVSLMENIHSFLVKECLARKCSLERGGTTYHLHYHMIIRIQAVNMSSVTRLLKTYLGWDKNKPDVAAW